MVSEQGDGHKHILQTLRSIGVGEQKVRQLEPDAVETMYISNFLTSPKRGVKNDFTEHN